MRLPTFLTLLFLVFVSASAGAEAKKSFIAEGPEDICPLMIGARVPDVTLVTPDHRPVVLRDALASQPTILIYYRGGW